MDQDIPKFANQFFSTRWSMVLLAGQTVSPESAAALEKLCHAYWCPIFRFARRKGWSEEDAKDLTQQFFARLLERQDFSGLDPRRGKFRTFLLAAFTHFMANEHDRVNALKRGGGKTIISMVEFHGGEISLPAEYPPETLYDLSWAEGILKTALQNLNSELVVAGKQQQFEKLKVFLTAYAMANDYDKVAKELAVESSSVPVLVHRLRQRYRELVRAEVAQTVTSPTELAEEMQHLFAVLNR
jgi:RNA polymerase sigma-70 factor (ECF subfamily)